MGHGGYPGWSGFLGSQCAASKDPPDYIDHRLSGVSCGYDLNPPSLDPRVNPSPIKWAQLCILAALLVDQGVIWRERGSFQTVAVTQGQETACCSVPFLAPQKPPSCHHTLPHPGECEPTTLAVKQSGKPSPSSDTREQWCVCLDIGSIFSGAPGGAVSWAGPCPARLP